MVEKHFKNAIYRLTLKGKETMSLSMHKASFDSFLTPLRGRRMLISRMIAGGVVISSVGLTFAFSTPSFADTTTTTAAPTTTTIAPPVTDGGLDSDLPSDTAPAATLPPKVETVAQEQAKQANSKLDKATKALLDAQLAVDTTSQQIQTTEATLAALTDQIAKNEALIAVRKEPLEQLTRIVKERAVSLYQSSSGAPTDAVSLFYYKRQTALAATAQGANFTDLKTFLKQQNAFKKIETDLESQKMLADAQEKQLQDLSVAFAKQLDDAKAGYEKTATLFLNAHALIGSKLAIDGKMCPIAGPMTHVDDWGNARSGGRTHKGNDLFNAFGTPNVAIVAGRMEHNLDKLGGTGVNIFGDDGNMYYYAHLSAWAGENRRVAQGEVVGYTGATGNAAGGAPHTHFEIRLGGTQHVNPYPVIRIICGV